VTAPPLIGISTSEMRVPATVISTPQGEPPRRELALGLLYPQAIERGGAIPVVLAPLRKASIEPLLDRLCGVCLSGGPDLDPYTYGGQPDERLGPTEPELDAFELALARGAMSRDLPVLGICRGAQVLNVARGGTLHTHLPDLPGVHLEHRQGEPGTAASHGVQIEPSSRLAGVYGCARLEVNSFHHQAADRLGTGLAVAARSADGVVEAIEDPQASFCVGVQWHAEGLSRDGVHPRLFEQLTVAALRHRRNGRRRRARSGRRRRAA
jgi:putative glutamine amidotransferase